VPGGAIGQIHKEHHTHSHSVLVYCSSAKTRRRADAQTRVRNDQTFAAQSSPGSHDTQSSSRNDGTSWSKYGASFRKDGTRGVSPMTSGLGRSHGLSMLSPLPSPSPFAQLALLLPGPQVHERRTLGDGACGKVRVAVKRLDTSRTTSCGVGGCRAVCMGGGGGVRIPSRQVSTEIRHLAAKRSSPYVVHFFDISQDPANPDVAPLIFMGLSEGSGVHAAMSSIVDALDDDRTCASCSSPDGVQRHSGSDASDATSSVRSSTHTHNATSITPNRPETPLETVECIARSLANGIVYLHSRGYSHGDIEPLNLPLTHKFNPQTGLLPDTAWEKLCDFGPSRRRTRRATNPSTPRPRTLTRPDLRMSMLLVGRLFDMARTSDPRAG
jgi:serine/threonine protein kinase